MVTIGDVTGKGVEAAALTSLVRYTMRATAEFVSSPAELLARLDVMLKKQPGPLICTAICLRLDQDRVTLAIGGHPLPIHITSDGAREIGAFEPLLGAFDGVDWHDVVLDLAPGSKLVIYTDGVTDAVGSDTERYGLKRLRTTLEQCRDLSAPELIENLTGALRQFQVGEHADDTAALVLRRIPSASQRPATQEQSEAHPIDGRRLARSLPHSRMVRAGKFETKPVVARGGCSPQP
jgi:sigma-B regulation protein RsbU (phosphoserine phosphatase)